MTVYNFSEKCSKLIISITASSCQSRSLIIFLLFQKMHLRENTEQKQLSMVNKHMSEDAKQTLRWIHKLCSNFAIMTRISLKNGTYTDIERQTNKREMKGRNALSFLRLSWLCHYHLRFRLRMFGFAFLPVELAYTKELPFPSVFSSSCRNMNIYLL